MNAKNQINSVTKSGEWAISEQGLLNLMTQDRSFALSKFKERSTSDLEDMREWFSIFCNQRQPMRIENGNAFIHVKGVLLDEASPIDLACGNTSYAEIIQDIENSNSDNSIKNQVFIFDSPGGTVAGMEEAQSGIAKSTKKTYGFIIFACSACYGLASQCDFIAATPSATSGNIGTILSWMDYGKMLEKIGIEIKIITNDGADLKGTFTENPMSESQKSFLKERINLLGENFWNSVISKRPQVDEVCKRAGWYTSEEAGMLGLIDMIATEKEYLNFIETNVDSFEA